MGRCLSVYGVLFHVGRCARAKSQQCNGAARPQVNYRGRLGHVIASRRPPSRAVWPPCRGARSVRPRAPNSQRGGDMACKVRRDVWTVCLVRAGQMRPGHPARAPRATALARRAPEMTTATKAPERRASMGGGLIGVILQRSVATREAPPPPVPNNKTKTTQWAHTQWSPKTRQTNTLGV